MKTTLKNSYKIRGKQVFEFHPAILELLRADEISVEDCGHDVFVISTTDRKYFFKVQLFTTNRLFYKMVFPFIKECLPMFQYEESELDRFAFFVVDLLQKESRKIKQEKDNARRKSF